MGEAMKRDSRPLETPRAGEVPGLYLGPFTTPRHAYWALDAVVKLFPLRSCEGELKVDVQGKGCFYREIGRCCGPCVGQTDAAEYAAMGADLVQLLETGEAPQLEALRARMMKLSEEWRFEDAAQVKEQLEAIEIVAARLRRLSRMRNQNNAVIAQPGLPDGSGQPQTALFLVRGGAVRRHLLIGNSDGAWQRAKRTIRETFEETWAAREFTAKTELDEMMILDRWLRSHGTEPCVAWMNAEQRAARQWLGSSTKQLRAASLNFLTADTAKDVVKLRGKIKI
jgi:excinuclease UvrABC nuclease subunit